MRILILGANSIVGWALYGLLGPQGAMGTCSPSTRRPLNSGLRLLDMLRPDALRMLLEQFQPTVVLHCAAICKVDKCERHPSFAWDINVGGTLNLLATLDPEVRLVYCSSDHVFSGDQGPYTEKTLPDPISYYGKTRIEAENYVLGSGDNRLVIRLPLCIGPSYNGRSGHLDWLRHRHDKGLPMTIVRDEYRSALPLAAAAQRVYEMARSDLTGLRHLCAERVVSRPELADYLSRLQNLPIELKYQDRAQRSVPHLGKVELSTCYSDIWACRLPSVIPDNAFGEFLSGSA